MEKEISLLDNEGRIPTYKVEDEFELLESLDDLKPSKRIVKTKKGLKAIKALIDLEIHDNKSWYEYLKNRNINNMNATALFYRGNKISFDNMFNAADNVAKSMLKSGLKFGDEIGVCVTNSPELVYILLAANKIGLKVNCFGAQFDENYLLSISDELNKKCIFISDDVYQKLENSKLLEKFDSIVLSSLETSLPKNPSACDEYEPKLESYYHYDNKIDYYKKNNSKIKSLDEYISDSKDYNKNIEIKGNLETDFLITYTSGSTKIGFPKQIIHKNRSLITMGRFHDPELCGNPKIPNLRGLAHIHPESNTDIITCISDNLMQGWSVALEPEYDMKKALDYIILNKPNYLDITTSFMLEAAKQYLIDRKFHEDGIGKKLPFLLAAFTVGEGTQKGEEKFINKFLRESRAGSGVSIKGIKLPFTTLSIGGGDCEHGGIYYTLWKATYQKLYSPILGRSDLGMLPVPYAVVTALKKDENGKYVECNYNENGVIVANSYTNLSCYKNNREATEKLLIKDNLGRVWVSCNTYGYVDKMGGIHVKGRVLDNKPNYCYNFEIDDLITKDTKNILSCTTVDIDSNKVINIQLQPLTKINTEKVISMIYNRLAKIFSKEELEHFLIRIIPIRDSFPLTSSGKRNIRELENMGIENCINLSKINNNAEKHKTLIKK